MYEYPIIDGNKPTIYASYSDCVEQEIVEPLGEYADDFEIAEFADAFIIWSHEKHGYYLPLSPLEFWDEIQYYDKNVFDPMEHLARLTI